MCEVLDQEQVGRKFDLQTRQTSGTQESRTNTANADNAGTTNNCINIPDYVRPGGNREGDSVKQNFGKENTQ